MEPRTAATGPHVEHHSSQLLALSPPDGKVFRGDFHLSWTAVGCVLACLATSQDTGHAPKATVRPKSANMGIPFLRRRSPGDIGLASTHPNDNSTEQPFSGLPLPAHSWHHLRPPLPGPSLGRNDTAAPSEPVSCPRQACHLNHPKWRPRPPVSCPQRTSRQSSELLKNLPLRPLLTRLFLDIH